MHAMLKPEAALSSKGKITLPAAMRARLGMVGGSKVKFFCGDSEALLKPELPASAYFGILRHLGSINRFLSRTSTAAVWGKAIELMCRSTVMDYKDLPGVSNHAKA